MNDSLVLARNGPQPGGRSIPRRLSCIALLAALIISSAPAFPAEDPSEACRELRPKAVEALRRVLDQEQRWIKVHAAEFLLALDYPQGVKETFLHERTAHESEPKYRIGIWRVLARTSFDEKHSAQWSDKIRRVFLDTSAPDRLHALESLAKLGCKVRDEEVHLVEEAAKMENNPMAPYAAWVLVNSGRKQGESRLAELLGSRDAKMRGTAAYALRHLRAVSPSLGDRLLELAQAEPVGSEARIDLVCAAAAHAPAERRPGFVKSLVHDAREGSPAERFQACDTLASLATGADLPMLAGFLSDPNGDVRASAAWAVLRVGRRLKHGLGVLDWSVILVYAVGILAIGWYYWRRTKTTEDYLLGGRKMRPLAVGLSFFAALFSTISYLAWPGEMIKYGPMILSIVVAYPLVAIVVGWFIIPYIMKLRITSAYEILETRLGLSVRILGSTLFLLLRLLWMAVIIYATVSKVLVPLLALDPSTTPYLSIVMGVVPLVYTAMGGLRAGVVADVLKSAILFAGAIVTIVAITISLGGVGAWWPTTWPAHWPEPNFGYDPTARVTFWGAVIAVFVWYICTAGSDQVAIQRYLATRDAKAARRVLNTSLITTTAVLLLLAAPLFGLFFMAMLVPWATSLGTLVGAACGIAVVAGVNYWEEITGTKGISFLWAMPLSLVVQIVLGALASLLPIGRRASLPK